ncbi:MAG: acyltransferase [Chloroflexota bacterium]
MSDYFVHPTALVESDNVGDGTQIWAFSHVLKGGTIGKQCSIADHCFVESGAVIGDYVTIKNGNMIWTGVTLEEGVFVGPSATFTNDRYPRSSRLPELQLEDGGVRDWLVPTVVRRGATIGADSILIAGIEIGEFAMVGAGATVTRDVKPYSLVIGSPAHHYQWVCRCGLPLNIDGTQAVCDFCQRQYVENGGRLSMQE